MVGGAQERLRGRSTLQDAPVRIPQPVKAAPQLGQHLNAKRTDASLLFSNRNSPLVARFPPLLWSTFLSFLLLLWTEDGEKLSLSFFVLLLIEAFRSQTLSSVRFSFHFWSTTPPPFPPLHTFISQLSSLLFPGSCLSRSRESCREAQKGNACTPSNHLKPTRNTTYCPMDRLKLPGNRVY